MAMRARKGIRPRTGKAKRYVTLEGTVETEVGVDEWFDAFINWIETRDETFGGRAGETDENGDPLRDGSEPESPLLPT